MNSYITFPLISKLPINIVKDFLSLSVINKFEPNIQSNTSTIDPDISFIPKWVNDDVETGNQGEMIAELYLKNQSHKNVTRVSLISQKKCNHDIEVDDQCYEVKTSKSSKFSFCISIGELLEAHNLGKRSNLFYIQLQDSNAQGYIINDFFNAFNLELSSINFIFKNNAIDFSSHNFTFHFNEEFLHKREPIPLNSELETVNKLIADYKAKKNN